MAQPPEVHLDEVNTFALGLSAGISAITPPIGADAGLPDYAWRRGGAGTDGLPTSPWGLPPSRCYDSAEAFIKAIWAGDLGAAATREQTALQIAQDALPGNLVLKLLQTALVYANEARAVPDVCSL